MEKYASVKEIAEVLGISERAVRKRAEKVKWPYINGGNGAKLFIFSKLQEGIRLSLAKSKEMVPYINKVEIVDYRAPVGSPELTDWQNRIALARADLIRAYLEEKKRARGEKRSVVEAAETFIRGYNTGQLMPRVFEVIGKTARQTVEAWVKKFRDADYDYTALATGWGNRKGQRKITDDEFNTILSFGLHPNRLRISEIVRLTKTSLKKRQIPSPSSKDTLRRALKDWIKTNYDKWVSCREGEKALNDKCLPYLERDAGLLEVGEVLVADGHTLNFQILHPFTGTPVRMVMITWYDWASAYPVGWEIMPTENVQCVAAGLRRAILTLGKMPKVAYLDNGKAFKAKIFTDKTIDFEEAGFYGMFARLGIETLFAWPYNAQAKPVERWFGTFNELERLMPTYTGASIADKPARLLRNEKLHQKIHEKKYGGWVPTIEEANRIIAGWVLEYAQRPHRGLKGLHPGEVLLSGKGVGVDEKALRYLMMSIEIKRVHRNGITFYGRNYYDDALYGYKDRVMIRYDLGNLSKLYVYDVTGAKLLCVAEAIKPVHPVAKLTGRKEDLQLVKEGIKRKRALKKATEIAARAFVENTPDLITIPETTGLKTCPTDNKRKTKKHTILPRAEAERIEAEAAKMKVIELTPKEPDPVYMTEPDRYEALLERECKGEDLSLDEMQFMRYFEKTDIYQSLKERMVFLREFFIAGPEGQVTGDR